MFKFSKSLILIIVAITVITGRVNAVEKDYDNLFNKQNNALVQTTQEGVKNKKPEIIVFIREGCGNCKKEEKFLNTNKEIQENFEVTILDIKSENNRRQWERIINKHKLSKVTPISLIGGDIIVGFSEKVLLQKLEDNKHNYKKYNINFYINGGSEDSEEGYSCKVDSAASCTLERNSQQKTISENKKIAFQNLKNSKVNLMTLPFFGKIDIQKTSLLVLSSVLGLIDGFNPCAMWVLLTFLIILSQVGSKKKMIYLAGLFILAEAVMYFLILNVWYQTWDFIQLDNVVTPMVGFISVGAGIYFLYKYYKNRDGKLVCEVTSLEHQQKTVNKIKEVVSRPISLLTIGAILFLAFSVNIIEFACSVGIPQSFTKILELNKLNFLMRQWYIFIYTLFYMADDFLVFALAIIGYQKFSSVGSKYSHLSTLIGGISMLILGWLLIFHPELLAM